MRQICDDLETISKKIIKPSRILYKKLRLAASEIAGLDDADLNATIFDAGDTQARPYDSTHNLLLLCATNLVNGSGPFPKPRDVKPLFLGCLTVFYTRPKSQMFYLKTFIGSLLKRQII